MFLLATALASPLLFTEADGTVAFSATSSLHAFEGRARTFEGRFDPTTLDGTLDIPAASLSTGLGPRDSRMHATALEAVRFPTIHFVVARVEGDREGIRSGSGSGDVVLVGRLTLRDRTDELAVPVTYTWEGDHLRLAGEVPLNWVDWGIPDPSVVVSTLDPALTLRFNVLARPLPPSEG